MASTPSRNPRPGSSYVRDPLTPSEILSLQADLKAKLAKLSQLFPPLPNGPNPPQAPAEQAATTRDQQSAQPAPADLLNPPA